MHQLRGGERERGIDLRGQSVRGSQAAYHCGSGGSQTPRMRNDVLAQHIQAVGPHAGGLQPALDGPHDEVRRPPRHVVGALPLYVNTESG